MVSSNYPRYAGRYTYAAVFDILRHGRLQVEQFQKRQRRSRVEIHIVHHYTVVVRAETPPILVVAYVEGTTEMGEGVLGLAQPRGSD